MSGLEIKDISMSPMIAAAAPEKLAAFIPAGKYQMIRLRNRKRLGISFFVL